MTAQRSSKLIGIPRRRALLSSAISDENLKEKKSFCQNLLLIEPLLMETNLESDSKSNTRLNKRMKIKEESETSPKNMIHDCMEM